MSDKLAELEEYKDRIPEFIMKLYHILEQKEYSEYLCWHCESEIAIRSVRKLEDKVLPNFFRHKRISSFIRQLNMYGFSKLTKLTKEKHTLYFKNQDFQRHNIKLLTKIKRNHKKSSSLLNSTPHSDSHDSQNISINEQLEANVPLNEYKAYVKGVVGEMMKIIRHLQSSQPEARNYLRETVLKCNQLLEVQGEIQHNSIGSLEDSLQNKNMMSTMRLLPVEPALFPSQCSFFHIN